MSDAKTHPDKHRIEKMQSLNEVKGLKFMNVSKYFSNPVHLSVNSELLSKYALLAVINIFHVLNNFNFLDFCVCFKQLYSFFRRNKYILNVPTNIRTD